MSRPRGSIQYPPKLIFRAAQLLLLGTHSAEDIAESLTKEFGLQKAMNRTEPFRLLRYAAQMQFVRLVAPIDTKLAQAIVDKFELDKGKDKVRIRVVSTLRAEDNQLVAEEAAVVAMERAKELLQAGRERIGIGLTTGRANRDFARRFAELMREEGEFPFSLHALAGGGPTELNYSPINFFNFFLSSALEQGDDTTPAFGLFTPTLCRTRQEWKTIQAGTGFENAYRQRHRINLICASLGVQCEHDLLRRAVEAEHSQAGKKRFNFARWAEERQIVANINYRPFTAGGEAYFEKEDEYRAITLFEIADLLKFRQDGGRLILIGRRCGRCHNAEAITQRAKAVLTLLQSPNLRVFSDLVLDETIAREVLKITPAQNHTMPAPVADKSPRRLP